MSKLLLTILLTGFCINAKAMSWGEQKSCEIKPIAFERDVCLKNFETRDIEITRLNSLHAAGKPDDRIKNLRNAFMYMALGMRAFI